MTQDSQERWIRASEHSWRYFELHAQQRMTVFNFFTVLAALILTGIASSLQAGEKFAAIGVALGLLLSILSFVFWKLDSRNSGMIKRAEAILILAESEILPDQAKIFTGDRNLENAVPSKSIVFREWTFGRSFRITFALMALTGVVAAALCGSTARIFPHWDRNGVGDNRSPIASSRQYVGQAPRQHDDRSHR